MRSSTKILRSQSKRLLIAGAGFLCLLFLPGAAFAEYYFEVLKVSGSVTSKTGEQAEKQAVVEGKVLTPATWLEVGEDSFMDLALDREWQNTIRIGEKTRIFLTALFPTGFYLERGDVFAKLDALPKDSTLEVQTPVAVAAVRGTVFRVMHKGQTKVENYSASTVYVFGVTSYRAMYGDPLQLGDNQTTDVAEVGSLPAPQRPMTDRELRDGLEQRAGLEQTIAEAEAAGRIGAIQSNEEVTRQYTKDLDERIRVRMAELTRRQKDKDKLAGTNRRPDEQNSAWDQNERRDRIDDVTGDASKVFGSSDPGTSNGQAGGQGSEPGLSPAGEGGIGGIGGGTVGGGGGAGSGGEPGGGEGKPDGGKSGGGFSAPPDTGGVPAV